MPSRFRGMTPDLFRAPFRGAPFARQRIHLLCAGLVLSSAALLASRMPVDDSTSTVPAPASSVEARASQPRAASSPNPAATSLHWDGLSEYISRTWRVSRHEAQRIVKLANAAALRAEVDPVLVLAVVARESSFRQTGNALNQDPDASVNPAWAHGFMQVAGRFHPGRMPVGQDGRMRVTTDAENLRIGAQILRDYLESEGGDLVRALQRYNGNPTDVTRRFSSYVLRVKRDLELAATRT